MFLRNGISTLALLAAAVWVTGCGSGTADNVATVESQVKSTVDAVNSLAEVVQKDPSSPEVAGLVETITANYFDPAAHPAETKQVLDTYNTKIKGKLKGESATRMKAFIDNLQSQSAKGGK
jgi:hypothetical protein